MLTNQALVFVLACSVPPLRVKVNTSLPVSVSCFRASRPLLRLIRPEVALPPATTPTVAVPLLTVKVEVPPAVLPNNIGWLVLI